MDESQLLTHLGFLHLPLRLHNSLLKNGIYTVDDFLQLSEDSISRLNRIGLSSAAQIGKHRTMLISSRDEDGEFDWYKYWSLLEIKIIPNNFSEPCSLSQVMQGLPQMIKEVFNQESDERLWVIIQRRFGLDGQELLTLEDLGFALQRTRERVRQLEKKAIRILRDVFLLSEYPDRPYHIHLGVITSIKSLLIFIKKHAEYAILESELLGVIASSFEFEPEKYIPTLKLIFILFGLQNVQFEKNDLEPIWGYFEKSEQRLSASIINHVDRLLTEQIVFPVSEIDLLVEVNRGLKASRRVSLDRLRLILDLCSSIEQYDEGFYRGRFEHLVGRGNQVERILIERAEPLHFREITRDLNHRLLLHGKKLVNSRNLVNQISKDRRFSPIGRSGVWTVASWSVDTHTIVELMEQCLHENSKPMMADEIYSYVKSRRPVQRNSIDSYLTFNKEFVRIDRNHWVMSSWPEAKNSSGWDPAHVGEFVEGFFKDKKQKELEYKELKEALANASKVNEPQARGMLAVNPVISTRIDLKSGKRIAKINPSYKDDLLLGKVKTHRKKKTLRELVEESVKEILLDSPGNQISLHDLVLLLVDKFNRRDKTFYSYISDLDFVEKLSIPESGKVVCRLKRDKNGVRFSEVELIRSAAVKDSVIRSLSFLNERDVDIALFLLSKEFESVLKSFLTFASNKGKISKIKEGHVSLDNMIGMIKKEQIITDQAVLHFLRHKRNDRSHGPMPSLQERRIMMRQATTTAGIYIDYIKFFDDLLSEFG